MRILAIDCAAGTCAAACLANGDCLSAISEPMVRGHAERIAPMISETIHEAGLQPQEIDAVVVTVGPGAFTGIRIGLSAAHGFALARNLPVLGISCLEVAIAPIQSQSQRLAILETKRQDFYVQAFGADGKPLTRPAALPAEDIPDLLPPGSWTAVGDAAPRLIAELGDRARDMVLDRREPENTALAAARIAARRITEGEGATALPAQPLYLRPPDVNLKGRVTPGTAQG